MTERDVDPESSAALPPRVVDGRESEDWFLRLPPDAQQRLRSYWDDRLLDGPRWRASQARRARRLAREGAVVLCIPLFLVNALLTGPVALLALLVLGGLVGAGVGLVLHATGGGRFTAAFAGTIAWLAVQLAGGVVVVSGSVLSAPPLMFVFLGLWLAACLAAVWGQRVEFRTLDGSR
ncbi:MAG: hypothetical protein IPM29_29735 [Planctomycetes bacterium]|nr:hypothetical protein [Planctomycetota bacterium]